MKIVTILGARPQFVKAAAFSREIAQFKDVKEVIVHSGQHFDADMSDVFFEEMQIPTPNYHLDINGLSHGAMTGRMIEKIEEILLIEKPDWILVYGDTNSTLAGALAASKLGIKIAHVEAGLRSFNNSMPEEINRILTDRISSLLFCPTDTAIKNLKSEGFDNLKSKIVKTGDIMLDAALHYKTLAATKAKVFKVPPASPFVVATVHRQENTDNNENLKSIIESLNTISQKMKVILPLHPRTKKKLKEIGLEPQFTVIDPVGYFDMIQLLTHSSMVMTDSGGLQKEAFFFKKPCVTLREETEWVELIDEGVNVLAGSHKDKILDCFNLMLTKKLNFESNLYGTGETAKNIIKELISYK